MRDCQLVVGIVVVAAGLFYAVNYGYKFLGQEMSKNPAFGGYTHPPRTVSPSWMVPSSRWESSSQPYLRVVKIEGKPGRNVSTGIGWATIDITVENISKQIVTAVHGRFEYIAGNAGKQYASILHRGKILPGSQETITLNLEIPRDGNLTGGFKVDFAKVEVE